VIFIFTQIFVLAIICERLVDIIKELVKDKKINIWKLVSLAICIPLAVIYNGDLLTPINLTTDIAYINNVLTGILISGGSNYIADLIKLLQESYKKIEVEQNDDYK